MKEIPRIDEASFLSLDCSEEYKNGSSEVIIVDMVLGTAKPVWDPRVPLISSARPLASTLYWLILTPRLVCLLFQGQSIFLYTGNQTIGNRWLTIKLVL